MRYFRARSGNSVASTAYAVMCSLANAISCERLTARGQCGQVGVENTWIVVGVVTSDQQHRLHKRHEFVAGRGAEEADACVTRLSVRVLTGQRERGNAIDPV